jgi:hypothetical protein
MFEKGNKHGMESRWKPGQSGNPAGAPKQISTLVREKLSRKRGDGTTLADDLVDELIADAQSDNVQVRLATRKELLARVYPAVSKHFLESEPGTDLKVSWQSSIETEPETETETEEEQ